MAAKYPSAIPTTGDYPDRVDDVDWIYAVRYNEIKAEVIAICAELGTLPKGDAADLKTRLAISLDAAGKLKLSAADKALVIHDGVANRVYAHSIYQVAFTVYAGEDWTADTIPIWTAPKDMAITIVQIHAVVMGSSTPILTYNIEERAKGSIGSAGTDIYASDQTADANGEDETSFSNPGIAAGAHLVLVPSAESGTVDLIHGVIYYRKNVE